MTIARHLEHTALCMCLCQVYIHLASYVNFQYIEGPWFLNVLQSCNVFPQRGTPPKEAIDKNNNFPHIVRFVDSDDDIRTQYYIAVEQDLHMECKNMTSAIFLLLAMHYVFNIQYHPKIHDVLYFIQERVLGLTDNVRKSTQYLSFTSAIACYEI